MDVLPIDLRFLAREILGRQEGELVRISYDGRRYSVTVEPDACFGFYSRFFSILPGNISQMQENINTYNHLSKAFPKSSWTRVFPSYYHIGVPIKVREVRHLLYCTAMPLRSDIEGGNPFSGKGSGTDSSPLRIRYDQINCLCAEDLGFSPDGVPPFSSDHGETFLGAAQVAAVSKIALSNFKRGRSMPPGFDEDLFWVNALKRCFGTATPIGALFDTPNGLYECTYKHVVDECKFLVLSPVEFEGVPHRVIFLQTQTTLESFQSNLDPEIGSIGVERVKQVLQRVIRSDIPYTFMGYSLGGIQAYLMMLMFPRQVSALFCVNNPGTTTKIHKWASRYFASLRTGLPPLDVKIYHDIRDLIPFMGARQPYYTKDEALSPAINWTCRYISSTGMPSREGLSGVPANIFDVLHGLVESFWIYHPELHLDPSKIKVSNIVRSSGDRERLGFERILAMCGNYFGRKGTFYKSLKQVYSELNNGSDEDDEPAAKSVSHELIIPVHSHSTF